MTTPSPNDITALAAREAFGKPLIVNVHRALVVEAIVSAALPDWRWSSTDYAPFDFEHADGTRLEVKQSAARQSWASSKPSPPRWDIASRAGFWEGATWTERQGRNADIYVLAHHPVTDDTADHRNAAQWAFYVIDALKLPETKSIGLAAVTQLTSAVLFSDLSAAVDAIRTSVAPRGAKDGSEALP